MRIFVADAFTDKPFCGNQAAVVSLGREPFPSDELMQSIAAEMKHSETAFVRRLGQGGYALRFFTPKGEVELCGHATVAAFTVLRELRGLPRGDCEAVTKAGAIRVSVDAHTVWLDMADAQVVRKLDPDECSALYSAYGLPLSCRPLELEPVIVNVGLSDVIMPVSSKAVLLSAVQNEEAVSALSLKWGVTGVHMYALDEGAFTARCRNFAPLYGIIEECATGTSNGGLTQYLYTKGLIALNEVNSFLQGESMGRPSVVESRIELVRDRATLRVGGSAVITLEGELKL